MLEIHLLGEFRLTSDNAPVKGLNASRMQSLLARLLLKRDVPQSRQALAFLLWPDSPESQARTNLRKLLHDLRRALPGADQYLRIESQTIQWRPDAPFSLDVAEFQNAIERAAKGEAALQAHLERAVTLYRGDLLPECDDEWIAPVREQFRHAFAGALEQMVRFYEDRREYPAAIARAQHLLQLDPLDEAACRALMRLHALDDNRTAAARVYRACRDLLRQELGVEPEDETRQLYERIMQARAHGQVGSATSQVGTLVGRVSEWQRLQRAWAATGRGQAQCVLITGEAGIGKTRLAEAFVASAAQQGIAAATARCYAAEGALPFGPVVAWLRSEVVGGRLGSLGEPWLGEVSRLLPELLADRPALSRPGPITEAWQRQRLFEALARAALTGQPVVMFIDDLQWADRETLQWLHFLLRYDPRAPLMVLGTVRSEELSDEHPLRELQAALQREAGLSEIELDPLNAADTAALAAHVAGRLLAPDEAAHLYRETEGLPLFVVESMHIAEGTPGAAWHLSPTVQAVIARRIEALSASARELAGLAATIGRAFTLDVLTKASEVDESALVRSIDELLRRRIIREHTADSVYDFSHDKIREVVLAGLSGARRRMLHRHVAEALEAAHAGQLDVYGGQIASHCEQAGLPERAIGYYQRAAEYARRIYANADAIDYYQRAQRMLNHRLDRCLPTTLSLPAIDEPLGDVLHHVTRDDDARDAYLQALARTGRVDTISRARLQRKIGNTLRDLRQYHEAMQTYQIAEDELGQPANGATPAWWQEWIQLQLEKDTVFYWLGQVDASSEHIGRLQPILKEHGTPSQQADFHQTLFYREFRSRRGVATSAMVSHVEMALDAFTKAGDQVRIPAATFGMGFVLLWQGKPDQAERPLLDALAMAERTGDTSLVARCTTYLTVVYRQLDRVEQAQHFVARSVGAAVIAHMPEYTALAEANAAWVAWRTGDWPGVRAHGQAAVELWKQLPPGHASAAFQWTARYPMIASALREADIARAVDQAKTLLDPAMQRLPDVLTAVLEQAVESWEHDRRQDARDLLEQSLLVARQVRLL